MVITNILFMPKQSRLEVKKLRSGFQMAKPFTNRTKKTGFRMVLTKWLPFTIKKTDKKSVRKMTI
jgi:hypothetical protein